MIPSQARLRDVSRSSRYVGHGMRWAAAASGESSPDESAGSGRRNRVVLAPRPWRLSAPPCGRCGNGDKKGRSPGRARISRQTIARGKPGCLGCTCSNYPACSARGRIYGCIQRPAFPVPSDLRGTTKSRNPGENHAAGTRDHVFSHDIKLST
jgi:hypothetical protein